MRNCKVIYSPTATRLFYSPRFQIQWMEPNHHQFVKWCIFRETPTIYHVHPTEGHETITFVYKGVVADDALSWPRSSTLWPDKYQFPKTLSQTKPQSFQLLLLLV